jgi:NAD+ synthase
MNPQAVLTTRNGTLAVALAQTNPWVGDVSGNLQRVLAARSTAASQGADIVLFTELVLSGYPPEDLVTHPAFVAQIKDAVLTLAAATSEEGPALLLTAPWLDEGRLYNTILLLCGGRVAAVRHKHELPNYGVFDEKRLFASGPLPEPVVFKGARLGLMICEDMWYPRVTAHLAAAGVDLLLVPNASPFEAGKFGVRLDLARQRVRESSCPLVYVNQVGGQDELVFDGASFAVDREGRVAALLPFWRESVTTVRWNLEDGRCESVLPAPAPVPSLQEQIYHAMVVGLRDYVNKNRFPGVVLGLSGGIDSALSAAVAVDALGSDRVRGVRLPSVYTSQDSQDDAEESARLLGIRLDTVPIGPTVDAVRQSLQPLFEGRPSDVTEENLQARIRGLILMAMSNKFGDMVLTTGNKSELSCGYATLYGDMCGGYSVLKDVYKTEVYRLAHWRNRNRPADGLGPEGPVVPARALTKAPSAELRPNQTDQDSLPPYDELDAVLNELVELQSPVNDVVAAGHDRSLVIRIQHLLFLAEYKRRQAPPGVKTTSRSFGRDRRYPITNRFREARGKP